MPGYSRTSLDLKQLMAKNISFLMSIYDKSRKEVCQDLDLSYTTFTDWIKGNTYPRMDALEKLSFYFRIHTRDFFIDIEKNEFLSGRLSAYAEKLGVSIRPAYDSGPLTVEDYYETPEGYPVELIRGVFHIFDESPTPEHQTIVYELGLTIGMYIKSKKGKCRVFPGPFDVELPVKKPTVVVPDITVICDPSLVNKKGCKGAPDWIIEVFSPSTKSKDKKEKLSVYEEAGVREYWMVDPDGETTYVYRLTESEEGTMVYNDPEIYGFGETILVGIYEDFNICLAQLDIVLPE